MIDLWVGVLAADREFQCRQQASLQVERVHEPDAGASRIGPEQTPRGSGIQTPKRVHDDDAADEGAGAVVLQQHGEAVWPEAWRPVAEQARTHSCHGARDVVCPL